MRFLLLVDCTILRTEYVPFLLIRYFSLSPIRMHAVLNCACLNCSKIQAQVKVVLSHGIALSIVLETNSISSNLRSPCCQAWTLAYKTYIAQSKAQQPSHHSNNFPLFLIYKHSKTTLSSYESKQPQEQNPLFSHQFLIQIASLQLL